MNEDSPLIVRMDERDQKEGTRYSCFSCPISSAVSRTVGEFLGVDLSQDSLCQVATNLVSISLIRWPTDPETGLLRPGGRAEMIARWTTPKAAVDFMAAWDSRSRPDSPRPAPISFPLIGTTKAELVSRALAAGIVRPGE